MVSLPTDLRRIGVNANLLSEVAWGPLHPPKVRAAELGREAGVGSVRITIPWYLLQPDSVGQPFRWEATDATVYKLDSLGYEILAVLSDPPGWAVGSPGVNNQTTVNTPPLSEYMPYWNNYVSEVVERYASTKIRAYAVWNEPNCNMLGTPEQYDELMARAAPIIRGADLFGGSSGRKVVLGGLVVGLTEDPINPHYCNSRSKQEEWLAGRLEANRYLIDVVGIHKPDYDPVSMDRTLRIWGRSDHCIRDCGGFDEMTVGKPIWVTEASSGSPEHPDASDADQNRQAEILSVVFELMLSGNTPGLERVYWWHLYAWGPGVDPGYSGIAPAGYRGSPYETTPSFSALRRLTQGCSVNGTRFPCQPVHELGNSNLNTGIGDHLYTIWIWEADHVTWAVDKVAKFYIASVPGQPAGTTKLYRCRRVGWPNRSPFLSTDPSCPGAWEDTEAMVDCGVGWGGVGCEFGYIATTQLDPAMKPLYWVQAWWNGDNYYTWQESRRHHLVDQVGWHDKGIIGYVWVRDFPPPSSVPFDW